MRAAGITTVGEFHYLHHRDPDAHDYAFDEVVLAAAATAGIRVACIQSYYHTGAVGQPLEGRAAPLRARPSPAVYWEQMDRLAARLDPRRESLAASVHSLRAGSIEDIAAIYDEARRRDLPFHIHVEEQRAGDRGGHRLLRPPSHGAAPGDPAARRPISPPSTAPTPTPRRWTASSPAGGTVCLCPTDRGEPGRRHRDRRARSIPRSGAFCLGSDSNARISSIEEMRWLEYVQRLATENRGMLRDGEGNVARVLLEAATAGGAAGARRRSRPHRNRPLGRLRGDRPRLTPDRGLDAGDPAGIADLRRHRGGGGGDLRGRGVGGTPGRATCA